ncbi:S9 family peptidase [Lysobacter brunescens]|uniref:S9 family peptidase n=1 Tax=Lysobacter brunescens TaxID=262323 RepID=A0ABW2Y7L3_9GAMM
MPLTTTFATRPAVPARRAPARIAASLFLLCFASLPVAAATAPLPRKAFVLQPTVSSVTLSPDGRRIAWLREAGRAREVWLRTLDEGTTRRLLAHTPAESLDWSGDGRWLMLASPGQLDALAVTVHGAGQGRSGRMATLGAQVRRELLRIDETRPAAAIVLETTGPRGIAAQARWHLVRIDARGRRELLHGAAHRILGFALDPRGRLTHVQRVEGLSLVVRRIETDGRATEVLRCTQMRVCTPLVAGEDGSLLLRAHVDTGDGTERIALLRLGRDGTRQVLHADPYGEADLDGIVIDPATHAPRIVAYRSTIARNHALDPTLRPHLDALAARLPDRDLRLSLGRGPGVQWLVEARGGRQQGLRWHRYDPATGTLSLLFDDAPLHARDRTPATHIPDAMLSHRRPVQWQASDGMRLHGFLQLPPGRDAARAPLVVLVHGGPWNHARPEYNGIAQYLAHRGYVVFEPNFRGSTGHGIAYTLAANGDFGNGRVQRDIIEGTRHLLASGIGDPQRVAIAGASFGGYAALLGVTFEPDLFKAAIAFVPPPDMAWTLRWILRNPESMALGRTVPMPDMLRMLALDPDDTARMAALRAQSPMANLARLRRPVLLVAGGEDRRVGIAGVVEYAARLKLAGKDVSLFVDDEAGHVNRTPLARESNLYLLEAMLHRHLGGPAPTPPDGALRGYLSGSQRLCGPTLVALCPRAPTNGRTAQPRTAAPRD